MSDCEFCLIIAGKIERYIVFEDPVAIAFLDDRPLFPGHCLLIPRIHYQTLADLPLQLIEPVFRNTQLLARAVQSALAAQGTFVAINNHISQSVPHLHIHIVPRRHKDGLKGFFWPRNPYRDEQHKKAVQEAIQKAIIILS
jgi:histidine triad (HIT) family protein